MRLFPFPYFPQRWSVGTCSHVRARKLDEANLSPQILVEPFLGKGIALLGGLAVPVYG